VCILCQHEFSDGGVEQLKAMLMLAVAYSSNLGGCGTLTGTAPNLILQEIIKKFVLLLINTL